MGVSGKLTGRRLPLSPSKGLLPLCSPLSDPRILVNLGFEELIVVFAPPPNNATGASPQWTRRLP